jgi:hypothetical protein
MTSPSFLTTLPHDSWLDLDDWVGQRQATYRFQLIHGPSGQELRDLNPVIPGELTHTSGQAIPRQASTRFAVTDTAKINTLTDRVLIWMLLRGEEYPLGRYMFADQLRFPNTGGIRSDTTLVDESFMIDQQISESFSAPVATSGIFSAAALVSDTIPLALAGIDVNLIVEPSPFRTIGAWPIGTRRGQIMEDLSLDGDYWPPYMDNQGRYRFKRTFDPAITVPTFNFDAGNKVIRSSITEVDDALTAANRFVVVGNGAVGSAGQQAAPIVGRYDIPASAPHSIENRGFVILHQEERQVASAAEAQAAATNLGLRQTIYERAELSTAPDPRHDGYDVVLWLGSRWLELAWQMPLREGAPMRHLLRKAYLS